MLQISELIFGKLLLGPEYTSKAYLASSTSSSLIAFEFFLSSCITVTFLLFFFLNLKIYMQQVTLLLRCTSGLSPLANLTIEGEDKSDNDLGMWQWCRQQQWQSWLGRERLFPVSIFCFILILTNYYHHPARHSLLYPHFLPRHTTIITLSESV